MTAFGMSCGVIDPRPPVFPTPVHGDAQRPGLTAGRRSKRSSAVAVSASRARNSGGTGRSRRRDDVLLDNLEDEEDDGAADLAQPRAQYEQSSSQYQQYYPGDSTGLGPPGQNGFTSRDLRSRPSAAASTSDRQTSGVDPAQPSGYAYDGRADSGFWQPPAEPAEPSRSAANGANPSQEADQWGDWGATGNSIGTEPQQQQRDGGSPFAWAQSAASAAKDFAARRQSGGEDQSLGGFGGRAAGRDPKVLPDITPLDKRLRDNMFVVLPIGQQKEYFDGTAVDQFQRWAGAAVATLLLSKFTLLAAGSFTFPLWWPWAAALYKNQSLASQYKHVGLWRARVDSVDLQARRMPRYTGPAGPGQPGRQPMKSFQPQLHLTVCDDSGARSEITVPYDRSHEQVRVGEAVELLVLSDRPDFDEFVAVKEVYLPESDLWIAKYPTVNRSGFLDVSLEIERERSQPAPIDTTAGPASYQPGPAPGQQQYY